MRELGLKHCGVLDMQFLKRQLRWPGRRTRDYAVVAAALVGLFASTIGIPIVERARKGGDQAFPCQDQACGCTTAEACWRGCCCSSPSQRLAWAKAHGVQPPEELLLQVRQQSQDVLPPHEAQSSDSLPGKPTATGNEVVRQDDAEPSHNHTQVAAATATAEKACCHKDRNDRRRVAGHDSSTDDAHRATESRPDTLHVSWIVGSLASKCRGQSLSAGGGLVALPPLPTVCWSFDWCLIERLPSTSEQVTSLSFPPPIPPPRA